MLRKLPDDAVHQILIMVKDSEPVATLAKVLHVAKATVYRTEINMDLWGKRNG